jgi:Transposase DNA-binding/Transposase DDE domain
MTTRVTSHERWATQEYSGANLDDPRRVRRMVQMAARMAEQPGGCVTAVFDRSAEREGAFRFLENPDVDPNEVARSAHFAGAQRCFGQPYVFVPVDGSSLNLTDRTGRKGLGVVGTRQTRARGVIVMTALAVLPGGMPVGVLGQEYWIRPPAKKKRRPHQKRMVKQTETQKWLDTMEQAREALAHEAPGTKPWFQLDRGGDAWPVILDVLRPGELATIRANHDRQLVGTSKRLWERLASQPVLTTYDYIVPRSAGRPERWMVLQIRAARVELDLFDTDLRKHVRAPLWAVLVRESRITAKAGEPVEWLLLTTFPVKTEQDALLVADGYAQRWRVEDFHKAWKSGACKVEENQLRDFDNVKRWAVLQASLAVRILRLAHVARTTPKQPATVELSLGEIQAIAIDREQPVPLTSHASSIPTIATAVTWLAEIGGYTGKSSGGPPGAKVLARGLLRIEALAAALDSKLVRPTCSHRRKPLRRKK